MDPDQTAPKEQSDQGQHCLWNIFFKFQQTKQTTSVVIGKGLKSKKCHRKREMS